MAKLCATIIGVALFCLFTLSLAGTPPENDESTTQVSLPLSEIATTTTTLRFPGEQVNTETDPDSAVVSSVPLTRTSFRPVNSRFHVKSEHPYSTVNENEEIPYDNDMVISSGENSEPVLHGEGQRMNRRRVRLLKYQRKVMEVQRPEERQPDDSSYPTRIQQQHQTPWWKEGKG